MVTVQVTDKNIFDPLSLNSVSQQLNLRAFAAVN
jgi:hypothetical protein